jgi:hypothetical protein
MNPPQRNDLGFDDLAAELERRFSEGARAVWAEEDFSALALRVFRYQFDRNTPDRLYCQRHGVAPGTLEDWRSVPPVPALAFKHLDMSSVGGDPEAVFLTSGTTLGGAVRGRHPVPRLSLYRASLLETFRTFVMGERSARGGTGGAERIRFLSLVPPARLLPDSSLSYMVTAAAEELATRTHWLVDAEGRLDLESLRAVAGQSADADEPVLVLGTALSLHHALERLADRPLPGLAQGSRIMETGGFKGAKGAVSRDELHARLSATTGVPTSRIVNEYGMTELLSQLYEPVLSEGPAALGSHVAPPWLRVRALDPLTLAPVPDGESGVLAFFDLANLGSVSAVVTQDVGAVRDGRLRLEGRMRGSEPRGCSRAMDELRSASSAVL